MARGWLIFFFVLWGLEEAPLKEFESSASQRPTSNNNEFYVNDITFGTVLSFPTQKMLQSDLQCLGGNDEKRIFLRMVASSENREYLRAARHAIAGPRCRTTGCKE